MAEEEKKSVSESPGVSPSPKIQPDSVSDDDEVFAPRDDMNALFFTKEANGELTNTLNINTNVKKIIETANWMERVNTLLKNKIRYAGDIDMVDTLINEGEKIGCKVYNPIMQLFWGSSPSLIKLNKIKELLDNVNKRRKICESVFQKTVYYYLPDRLAYNCVKGLAKVLYECERYGIFEQDDTFEAYVERGGYSFAPFALRQLFSAQNYLLDQQIADARSPSALTESEARILEERSNIDVEQKDREVTDENKQIQKTLDQFKNLYRNLYSNPDEPKIKTFVHKKLQKYKLKDRYNKLIERRFSGTFQEKKQEVDQIWNILTNLNNEVARMIPAAKTEAAAKSIIQSNMGSLGGRFSQRRR
jgi:hypothetical protein